MSRPTWTLRTGARTNWPRSGACVLLATVLVGSAGGPVSVARAGQDDDTSYRAGIGLLNKGMHDLAAAELRAYLNEHAEGARAASARYALGVCLSKMGKHTEAQAELARVIPTAGFEFQADAMLLWSQCAVAAGDDSSASVMLSRLVKEHPAFAQADRASALLGETLYRAGKYDEARAVLGSAITRWPESGSVERARLFASLTEAASGDWRSAADGLAELRAKYPEGVYIGHAALVEAQCRHRLGELAEASALYDIAAKRGDEGIRPEAMLGRAQVARALGKPEDAERVLREMGSMPSTPAIMAGMELERGRILLDQGKAEAALEVLARLTTSAPPSLVDDAAYWAAKCELKLGRFEAAAEDLALAAQDHPASELLADMLFDRASALSRAGDDAAALGAWADWRARFAGSPLAPEALAAQAGCEHRLGNFDGSTALCEQFLAKSGEHARAGMVELLLAENRYLSKRYEEAAATYRGFLDRHGQEASAWRAKVRLGLCLLKLEQVDEGAGVLARALAEGGEQEPALRRAAVSVLGEQAFAASDWAGAEKWFGLLARETVGQAEEADAVLRQGLSIQRQGRLAEAIPLFERAMNAAPQSAAGLHAEFELAQAQVETGSLSDAQPHFEAVVQREADAKDKAFTPHALRHLAGIASKQGKPEEAARILAKARDAGADGDGEMLLQQGAAWMTAGKFAEAERAYSNYADGYGGSAKAGEARARRAIAINRQGRHEESLAELDAVMGAAKGAPLEGEMMASALYERALALRQLSRDEDAAEAYRDLLERGATPRLEAYATLELAHIEASVGRHAEALVLLDRCRAASAKAGTGDAARLQDREVYTRGVCLLKLGKAAESAASLATFAERFPESELSASAGLVLGEALLQTGRAPEAARELRKVVDSQPPEETAVAASLRLGEALAALQQWTQSEQVYTAFLDQYSSSELWFQARFGQGWSRENQGRHDAAIEAYRDVVARHQGATAARAQFQIGECLYAQKKYEAAAGELLKVDVLYSYPEWSAAALYEAGRCLGEMGRAADAERQFEDLVNRFPETKWAKLATIQREKSRPPALPGQAREVGKSR